MTNIDFLPARYKEQSATRRKHAWRVVVFLLFGGSVSLAALFQMSLRRSVATQLELLAPQHQAAEARRNRLTVLQQQLIAVRQDAELYTYLRHPWPRTQILAAIADEIPEEISVRSIAFVHEQPTSSQPQPRSRRPVRRENTEERREPQAVADLKQLREKHDSERLIVVVEGETTDIADLHLYARGLTDSPLVDGSEIGSLEAAGEGFDESSTRSQFTLRIRIKPGYGQPGGPSIRRNEQHSADKQANVTSGENDAAS